MNFSHKPFFGERFAMYIVVVQPFAAGFFSCIRKHSMPKSLADL